MKLSVALIIHELRKASDPPVIDAPDTAWENAPVSGLRIYNGGDPSDELIYLAEPDDIGQRVTTPIHLLIAGLPDKGRAAGVAYVGLPLRELINRVERIFSDYSRIETELNMAIAKSESLRTVLSICARFFNNPITINDLRMRFVETSDNVEYDLMPEYFKVVLDTGYIDIRIMNAMKKRGYDKLINSCSDTLLFDLEEIPVRYFSKNIYEGHQITACLVIHEVFSPIAAAQSVLVDQVTQIIDTYAFKSPRGKQASMTRMEKLISELLDGRKFEDDTHSLYLGQVNWDTNDGFYLIRLQVSKENYSMSTAQYTFAYAQSIFPGSLMVERDDFAAIVICIPRIRYDFGEAMIKLEKYISERHDRAAVSRRFDSLGDIREHFKAVSLVLKLGEAVDPGRAVYNFEEYSLQVMLRLCGQALDPRVFCMREALTLSDFDRDNGSDFFRSLYTYLLHNKSLSAAAEELKVHRNTLLYRLGRVSEITGLDVSGDGILLPMLLSYQILRYRSKLENVPIG